MAIKISGTNIVDNSQGLRITGVSTFTTGPVFIGAATSTGTASQPLQVTGGAYVSGNIGIGTTTPITTLDVIGNHYISGFVGIGTTNSTDKLDVNGIIKLRSGLRDYYGNVGVAGSILTVVGAGLGVSWTNPSNITAASSLSIENDATDVFQNITFVSSTSDTGLGITNRLTFNASSGILSATAFVGSGASLTGLIPNALVNIDTNQIYYPLLSPVNSGSISSISVSSNSLVFNPGPNYLGIGTTNPTAPLQVFGSTSNLFTVSDNTTTGSIFSVNNTSGIPYIDVNATTNVIALGPSSGNIGLGTTNPTQKLQVQGSAYITGALYDSLGQAGSSGQILQSTNNGTQWTTSAAVGFAVTTQNGNYTLVSGDNGKIVSNSGASAVWTIPTGLSTGFNVTLFNNTSGNQTITPSGVTLYLAGTSITSISAFEQRGLATLVCVATNVFVISGAGIR